MKSYLLLSIIVMASIGLYSQQPEIINTASEKDFIPEGITIDTKTNTIYVSSINRHKIIGVDLKGNVRDFVTESQDGLMEALGMKIDSVKNLLWVTSILKENNRYHSKVHAFDLRTGRMKDRYELKDTSNHLLNDLVIAPDGYIYVTDSYYSAVYRIDPTAKQLSVFSNDSLLRFPNGIAQLDQNRLVIATYSNGPVILDLKTKATRRLHGWKDSLIAHGLDGLVLVGNKLFGVQNTGKTQGENAVVQYELSPVGDSVVNEKIIDRGNEEFHDPTTAAYGGNRLYVIANSYLTEYNQNKSSTKGIEDKLKPVVILVYDVR